jgi:O-antigen/teichoic acid export membrane protein
MLVKHVVSSTIAAGLSAVCGIALAILTSRLLGVDGRGDLALVLNAIGLVLPLTSLGLKQSAAYFIGKQDVAPSRILRVHALVAPFAAALTLAGSLLLLLVSGDRVVSGVLATCLFGFVLARIAFDYLTGLLLARARIYVLNALTVARAILEAVCAGATVWTMQSVEGYFIGIAVGSGIAAIATCIATWRMPRPVTGNPAELPAFVADVRRLVGKGVWYAAPMFVMGLNYGVDILMLGALSGSASVGLYSAAVTIVNALWFLPGIVNFVVFSHGVATPHAAADAFSKSVFRNALRVMALLLPIVALLGFVAEPLIGLVFGRAFEPASAALVALLPGAYLLVLFKLLNGDLAARGHTGVALRAFSVALAVNVAANFWLIPEYSHVGAAVASTISYSTGAALFLWSYLKLTRAHD